MFEKIFLVLIVLISHEINANERSMVIDISQQRLYLYQGMVLEASFPVSSSKYGEGSKENSFKTPLGEHIIKEMIGEGAKINTIFTSRINTTKPAKVINDAEDSKNDYVTSRIMWLDGLEKGQNKGGDVDSYQRYIYIHGTHEEGLIGSKASHGCIRMFNTDVIVLFDMVKIGTKVLIKA